jgi:ribosomal-protein-alanine N-acetyltransferase
MPDYVIAPMAFMDLEEVLAIERASFRFPWSGQSFVSELALPYSVWRVARAARAGPAAAPQPSPGPLVGYAGLQAILDEGHIMNVAVHPDYRRRGIGELLLLDLCDQARPRGVLRLTLEVRATNLAAQGLYHKYGFEVAGRRPRYYGDGEDALIMWTGRLDMPGTQERWAGLRRSWQERWVGGGEW